MRAKETGAPAGCGAEIQESVTDPAGNPATSTRYSGFPRSVGAGTCDLLGQSTSTISAAAAAR